MPASICDPVSSALRLSLTAEEFQSSSLLDSRLYSSAKSVLITKIEFEESGDYQSNVLDGLKSKYVVIRPKKSVLETKLIKKELIAGNQSSGNLIFLLLSICVITLIDLWMFTSLLWGYLFHDVNIYCLCVTFGKLALLQILCVCFMLQILNFVAYIRTVFFWQLHIILLII